MTGSHRLGLLGGTFDPVHVGHLHIAACALRELGLDEVRFLPAGSPPHKSGRRISDPEDRLRMLELATADTTGFTIDTTDLETDRPSYTSDLLARIHASDPDAQLWFIIGSDSLAELHTWHQPQRVLDLARLAVATRPGWDFDDALDRSPVPGLRTRVDSFSSVPVDLSASTIRSRIAHGQPVDWLVPSPVLSYIQERRLYSPS